MIVPGDRKAPGPEVVLSDGSGTMEFAGLPLLIGQTQMPRQIQLLYRFIHKTRKYSSINIRTRGLTFLNVY